MGEVVFDGRAFDVSQDLDEVNWLLQGLDSARLRRLALAVWLRIPEKDREVIRALPTVVVEESDPLKVLGHLGDFGLVTTNGHQVGRVRLFWPPGLLSDVAYMSVIAHEFLHAWEEHQLAAGRERGKSPTSGPVDVTPEMLAAFVAALESDKDFGVVTRWGFWREFVAFRREVGQELPEWFINEYVDGGKDGHQSD